MGNTVWDGEKEVLWHQCNLPWPTGPYVGSYPTDDPRERLLAQAAKSMNPDGYVMVKRDDIKAVYEMRVCRAAQVFDRDEDGPTKPMTAHCVKQAGHRGDHGNGYFHWTAGSSTLHLLWNPTTNRRLGRQKVVTEVSDVPVSAKERSKTILAKAHFTAEDRAYMRGFADAQEIARETALEYEWRVVGPTGFGWLCESEDHARRVATERGWEVCRRPRRWDWELVPNGEVP